MESENRGLEQLIEILKDPALTIFQDGKCTNNVCEHVMILLSLTVSIDKLNQVIKVVLSKLAEKDIESCHQLEAKLD